MSLEQDAAALLSQVEAYRQGECAKLRKEALHEAEALTRQAHGEARRRMREVLAALRRDADARIAATEARTQAWRRSREHRATQALLEGGLAALRDELVERWRNPATRAAWVDTLVRHALATLPRAHWQIRHPPDWPEAERQSLAARLPEDPEWQPSEAISAGVCFCASGAPQGDSDPLRSAPARGVPAASGSETARTGEKARVGSYAPQEDSDPLRAEARVGSYACLDGTLEGLLADRAAVEAALLAALEEQAS